MGDCGCGGGGTVSSGQLATLVGPGLYATWLAQGNTGTLADMFASFEGAPGAAGPPLAVAAGAALPGSAPANDSGMFFLEVPGIPGGYEAYTWDTLTTAWVTTGMTIMNGAPGAPGLDGDDGATPIITTGALPPATSPASGLGIHIQDAGTDTHIYTYAAPGPWSGIVATISDGAPGAPGQSALQYYQAVINPGGSAADFEAYMQGSQTFWGSADPNTLSLGNKAGDLYIQSDGLTSTYMNTWEGTGLNTWTQKSGIVSGAAAVTTDLFRATKVASEPIPIGAPSPVIVAFGDDSTVPNFDGAGAWFLSKWICQNAGTYTFRLVSLRISRTGTGTFESFDVVWKHKPEATGIPVDAGTPITLSVPSGSTGETLALLISTPLATQPLDEVYVEVVSNANLTDQFNIEINTYVYNQ